MNEKGAHLVEIVAAIVLISIILISFVSIFIQSRQFEKRNEEKYTAIQLSEEILHLLETNDVDETQPNILWETLLKEHFGENGNADFIEVNHKKYYPHVTIKNSKETNVLLEEQQSIITISIDTEVNGQRKEVVKNYGIKKQ